jgi:hypothetical protein
MTGYRQCPAVSNRIASSEAGRVEPHVRLKMFLCPDRCTFNTGRSIATIQNWAETPGTSRRKRIHLIDSWQYQRIDGHIRRWDLRTINSMFWVSRCERAVARRQRRYDVPVYRVCEADIAPLTTVSWNGRTLIEWEIRLRVLIGWGRAAKVQKRRMFPFIIPGSQKVVSGSQSWPNDLDISQKRIVFLANSKETNWIYYLFY